MYWETNSISFEIFKIKKTFLFVIDSYQINQNIKSDIDKELKKNINIFLIR